MPYSQSFGLNRSSPLNNHTKYHCDPGNKNEDGECVGWEYYQDKKKEEKNPASNIIDKNNKYSKEQLADYSYDNGYNIAGENTFGLTKDEMEAAVTQGENSKSLDMIAGEETWENSPYNTQPKKGYDRQGNAMRLHEGEKTTFDGQVVEDKDGQKFKAGIDEVQKGVEFASMIDPTGFIADGLNASISGVRGIGALAQGDYEQAKKFGKAGLSSTFFMIPGTDIGKVGKFNKMMGSVGKTVKRSRTGKYKQPIFQKDSNVVNMAKGLGNFALRKGKDTKLNKAVSSNISSFFGGGKASQFVGKKLAENTTSAKGIKNYSKLQNSDKEKES
jgi:hypothetical protein